MEVSDLPRCDAGELAACAHPALLPGEPSPLSRGDGADPRPWTLPRVAVFTIREGRSASRPLADQVDDLATTAGVPWGQLSTMGGGILVLTCFHPTSPEAYALKAGTTAAHPGAEVGIVPSPSLP